MTGSHLRFILLSLVLFAACTVTSFAQHEGHHDHAGDSDDGALLLGTIEFPTSGKAEAEAEFKRGVLALHSFWYPQAQDHFRNARALDPNFAMAYWGEAMAHDHPLWLRLDTTAGRQVLADLDSVVATGSVAWTPREQAYVDAIRIIYQQDPPENHRAAYAAAMQGIADAYPDDDEAAAFAALARMTVPGFDYEKGEDLVAVAAPLEEIFQRAPNHPGVVHYLIHVYDSPTYAPLGLRAARSYAEIAPASSHAVHMPSHIFRELGMWEEMAASNERAYQVSVDWQERTNRPVSARDFHSFQWLLDAYLNLGRFADAGRLVEEARRLEREAVAAGSKDARELAFNRSGFELTYRERARLAGLPQSDVSLPDGADLYALPSYQTWIVAYVQAINGPDADYEQTAAHIRRQMSAPAYADMWPWVQGMLGMFEAERMVRRGDLDGAVAAARAGREAELDADEGEAGSSSSRLAELLLEKNEFAEAEALFEELLGRNPRHPWYTLGHARAAAAMGDRETAVRRYGELQEIWRSADSDLPALVEARRYVGSTAGR